MLSSQPDTAPLPWRSVWLPSALLAVAMFNLTLIVAGLRELMLDDLGGTARDASLFFSIEMLAYVIFAPLWGVVSDRWGHRRPMIVCGFLASGVIYLLYLQVTSVPLLLAMRFVQGAFSVMGWSLLMALVLDQPNDKRRGRYMGVMGASLIFGVSIGAPLGGYVTRMYGARAPLLLAGILFLVIGLASLLVLAPNRLRQQPSGGEIVAYLKRTPRLWVPYLFHFIDRYTVGFFIVLFPMYLATLGIDDPAVRGRYLGLFLLPFAFLQYFTGRLSERLGPLKPLFAGSLVYGAAMCFVGVSSLYGLWWVMAVLGVMASVMFPPAIMLTAQLSEPHTRGVAMGGFNLAGSLGFAVGPLVGHWAYTVAGFGFAFVVAGTFEIAVVIITFAIVRRWR